MKLNLTLLARLSRFTEMSKLSFQNVKLQTQSPELKNFDIYEENKNRLGFLPTIFILILLASLGAIGFSYFKSIDTQNSQSPQSQLRSDSLLPIQQNIIEQDNQLPNAQTQNQFSLESTFDTRRLNRFTYHLSGKCQDGISQCSLWQTNNFSGESILLQKEVVSTGKNQENEIKPGSVIRFAKNQDITGGLNFILISDKNAKSYRLIRLDLDSLKIIENSEIKLGQKEYPNYFR